MFFHRSPLHVLRTSDDVVVVFVVVAVVVVIVAVVNIVNVDSPEKIRMLLRECKEGLEM